MKNILGGLLLIAAAVFPQQISHEVRVVNIEVPVRVFDGDKFVDHLKIDDFEVLEDGIAQKIEAVYLVRKTAVQGKTGHLRSMPGPPFRPLYNAYSSDKLQKYGVEPGRGDEIEVAAGPFKSLRGAFKKDVSDQDPVIILLDYVSHQGRLLIEKSKLKKVVD